MSHVPGINRGIAALPLSHSFGLLVTVGGYHTPEPSSSVLQRWFEPAGFVRLAAEHRSQAAAWCRRCWPCCSASRWRSTT